MSIISWGFPNQQQVTDQQIGGLQQYTEVSLTSAQILTLNSSPVMVLPPSPAGTYYEFAKGILEYTPGTTPYTLSGGTPTIQVGANQMFFDALMLGNFDNLVQIQKTQYNYVDPQVAYVTAGSMNAQSGQVDIGCSEDPTAGDGTLKLKLWYIIHNFG